MRDDVAEAQAAAQRTFLALRPTLLGLAYRMLGTVGDAEDIVQEAWTRWQERAEGDAVTEPAAYLRTVTTRLCIDRYRAERRRRAHYSGPWLPEPVITEDEPFDRLDLRRSASCALLWILETLTPLERAAFVLAEAFDYRPREIAAVLDRTEANCRQLLHRARRRIAAASPMASASPDAHRPLDGADTRLLAALLDALTRDDAEAVEALLTEDVAFVSDGGGLVQAVSRPVTGRRAVLRLLLGLGRQQREGGPAPVLRTLNGGAGLVLMGASGPETVLTLACDGARIRGLLAQRNPRKLARLGGSPG